MMNILDIKDNNISLSQHFSYALSALCTQKKALYIVITAENALNKKLSEEIDFFSNHTLPILHFPDWETLPYDHFSPYQDIISERLKTLSVLPNITQGILFISLSTLMQKLLPVDYILRQTFFIRKGDQINLIKLREKLIQSGYQLVSQVIAPGEFAIRGSLFDIFPMGSMIPYRLDLFDNEIESIREFDPDTQRSVKKIEEINLLPAQEYDKTAVDLFREQWRENFEGNPTASMIYETISQGGSISGIEYYLPLFFKQTSTLFDYLPTNTVFIKLDKITETGENFWSEIKSRYESLRHNRTRPILPPEKLYLTPTEILTRVKFYQHFSVSIHSSEKPDIYIDHKAQDPFGKLKLFISEQHQKNNRILFCTESKGRREALLSLFHKIPLPLKIAETWKDFQTADFSPGLIISPIEKTVCLTSDNILLIPENVLLGEHILLSRRKNKTTDAEKIDHVIKNLSELTIGAPVVHLDHGVGRYQGLQTLTLHDITHEFLVISYANADKLYVPVADLHLISRYSGMDADNAPLHRLGSDQFEKARKKAARQICDTAAELLEIHAKREMCKGIAYQIDDQYDLFARQFPFEETQDQLQAIDNVLADMKSSRRMDRLICGDVGFGKTEVAMRAAFIAAQNGYQVCVLVPTTLLTQQHFQNFSDRFSEWPIKIGMLSRFCTAQAQAITLQELQLGKIDIIIGTHKLLQPSIKFNQLGLLIIDEEHRFGVKQKEKFKALRAEVDILTLTATPIPRTLNMSISGMRDLSIISTPPAKRLSIKTFVHKYDLHLLREAILREILRGGQVYYLHNNVETMRQTAEKLREKIPEARIAMAHGQMPERELETIMREFTHQQHNVLICTTIIETGIDIPSANTIIIDRADKFGLAQLHQLRGRVGRSHHQAYAYLFIPSEAKITPDAQKRLEAITMLEDLGAGFSLATQDLEIRGAGQILGDEQSGNMQEIGFSLYMDLLNRAIKSLKKLESLDNKNKNNINTQISDLLKSDHLICDIDLQIPALIPADYLPDAHGRLVLYKRLASIESNDNIDELKVEFIDRFGLLPQPAQNLFALAKLKLKAAAFKIAKIHANNKNILIIFQENNHQPSKIDPLKIINLIQKFPLTYKFEGENKIRILHSPEQPIERINYIENFLETIKG